MAVWMQFKVRGHGIGLLGLQACSACDKSATAAAVCGLSTICAIYAKIHNTDYLKAKAFK